jgi:hypothetical protein
MVMTTSFEAIISDRPDDSKVKSVIRPDLDIPEKQHNRPEGTACCSASNGMPPDD